MITRFGSLLSLILVSFSLWAQHFPVEPDMSSIERLFAQGEYQQVLKLVESQEKELLNKTDWTNYIRVLIYKGNALRGINSFDSATKVLEHAVMLAETKLPSNSTLLASTYEALGDLMCNELLQYREGLHFFLLSLKIMKLDKNKQSKDLIRAFNNVGIAEKSLGNFEVANNYHHTALGMVSDTNDPELHHNTLYNLGELNLRILEYDSAFQYFTKAIEIWEKSGLPKIHPALAGTYKGLGWVYSGKGDFDRAIEYELQALRIYESVYESHHAQLGRIHLDISYEYQQKKDYDQALQHTNQALIIYKSLYHSDHPSLALVHHSLGHILFYQSTFFNLDFIDKSIEHYRESLRIDSVNYPEMNTPAIAVDYHGIALAYKWKGEYDMALKYMLVTMNIQRKLFGEESLRLINTINNVGAVYIDLNEFDSARFYFHKALDICNKQEKERTLDLVNIHKNLADAYNFEGKHQDALKSINQSLSYLNIQVSSAEELILPALDQISFRENLIYVLPRRAKALLGLYGNTKEAKHLERSLGNNLKLTEIYADIIESSKSTVSQIEQIPSLVETYENAIFGHAELLRLTNDDIHKKQAFQLAEKSKAILLLKNVKTAKNRERANIPEHLQNKEDSLRRKVNEFSTQLSIMAITTDTQGQEQALAQENLLKTRYGYQQLQDELTEKYPQYYNDNHIGSVIGLSDLQQALRASGEALIEYVIGEDKAFVFLVSPETLEFKVVEAPGALEGAAKNLRTAMLTNDIDQFSQTAFYLYQMLFEPIEAFLTREGIDHINIVADGFLAYVPFEALTRSNPQVKNYKTLDYLLKHYCINYNYSASLKLEDTPDRILGDQKVLAFAPVFQGKATSTVTRNAQTLTELPYAQKEINNIIDYFEGTGVSGDAATETAFKEMAGQYQMLHLATHALTDDNQPDLSRLYFSQNDSLNDGLLHAYELYDMQLNADLVTLSACNTGIGKFYKGEGIASLARAFRYAGCYNIVMSLWAVADQSTSRIMSSFYRFNKKGVSKADALRQAKLQYLDEADANTADPFYWAAFTLMGNSQPVAKPTKYNWQIGSVVLLLLSGIVYFLMRKRRLHNFTN